MFKNLAHPLVFWFGVLMAIISVIELFLAPHLLPYYGTAIEMAATQCVATGVVMMFMSYRFFRHEKNLTDNFLLLVCALICGGFGFITMLHASSPMLQHLTNPFKFTGIAGTVLALLARHSKPVVI